MEKIGLAIFRFLLKLCFRVEVKGLENFHNAGNRVLILPNHQSFLDPVLLSCFLPEKPNFAINTLIAEKWLVRQALGFFKVFRVDPTNPMSAKSLIDFLQTDKKVVIFPEGRITVTGSLMKVYEGPGMFAEKSHAKILPIHIEGAQYTLFSRLKGKVRRRLFPKITITIFPAYEPTTKSAGRDKRAGIAKLIERKMSEYMFAAHNHNRPIISSILDAANIHGKNKVVAEDINRKPHSYRQLFLKTNALSSVLGKAIKGENIGVLLPNTIANLVTILSLHKLGKIPAMLNFSAGSANIINACKTVQVKTILTSRAFIEKAELGEIIAQLKDFEVVYLEDVGKKISPLSKISSMILSHFPKVIFAQALKTNPHSPAVILFTSGSEGVPKGVALSHANIQSNIKQAEAIIDFSARDIVLNAMPMFHSFGLTVGTFLPVMCGMRMFLYPSPLHFNIIPEIAYAIRATLIFGTDTFLTRYAKAAHPYDFSSIRYVIAGAERLKQSTRELWFEKFGVRILEGYGVTETSPFISVNTAMDYKSGTVGKIAPAIEYKLVPVEGITEGGELWVKGPNIMLGYIKLDKPGVLQPPEDGWYATGDIVTIDEEGFLKIVGRAKRFAKIAGEMVSLPMVEECASSLWKDEPVGVVAVKDEKKGEQIVVITPNKSHNLDELKKHAAERGLPEIAIPKRIHYADIPLLGSGKTDYPKLQKLVEESV